MQMEIYEDYKNLEDKYRLLEARILQFHAILDECSLSTGEKTHEGLEAGYWKTRFKEHFNITIKTHGE